MSSETTNQPIDSYSTEPIQIAPWKRWAVNELVRQNLLGDNSVNNTLENVSDINGLSEKAAQSIKNIDLNDVDAGKSLFVWNMTDFRRQLRELKSAFPSNFLHTVATKTNPLEKIMEIASEEGIGAEAASLGELMMALKVHKPENIVFDCPSKTMKDIEITLKSGVGFTLDNLGEVGRVDAILNKLKLTPTQPIGLRLNPQIGLGTLATYSVSKPYSKFGVPITEEFNDVKQVYLQRKYMNMIHVHAGSQSYTMEQISVAIRRVLDLALDINKSAGYQQIKTIDIGGGLCTNFSTETNTPSLHDWANVLKEQCPELFTGEFKVITELGRRLLAKQGFVISKIEYVKTAGGRRVLLQHVGADVAVRTVYKPQNWPLRVTLFGADGQTLHPQQDELLSGELLYADIAGPCCIDDVLAPNLRPLPACNSGDLVLFHDTGAYYHSAYSYYNMRQVPALYSFEEPPHWTQDTDVILRDGVLGKDIKDHNGEVKFDLIRPQGSIESVLDFFTTKQ
jgi:diaminopimelate decarboxylase